MHFSCLFGCTTTQTQFYFGEFADLNIVVIVSVCCLSVCVSPADEETVPKALFTSSAIKKRKRLILYYIIKQLCGILDCDWLIRVSGQMFVIINTKC